MTEKIKSRVSMVASSLRDHTSYERLLMLDAALRSNEATRKIRQMKARLARFGLEEILDPLTYDLNTKTFRRKDEYDREFPFVFTSEKGLWGSEDGALAWAAKCFRDQEDPKTNTYKELVILKELFDDLETRARIGGCFDYISLIDLGAGNGEKAKTIIKRLTDFIVCYYPVDKGMYMNAVALTNISSLAQREDCVLADQNDMFYEIAQVKHDKGSLDNLLATAREALSSYDLMIEFNESFPRNEEKLISMMDFEDLPDDKLSWTDFFNDCLKEMKQRCLEIQTLIENRDLVLLRKLSYFYELLGRDCVSRADIRKRIDNGKTCYYMGGLFSDTMNILATGHTMSRYDWEKLFFGSKPLNNWIIKYPDFVNALKNQKGFIQYTAPSVGINADFNDINKVLEVLNYLRVFENDPRLVMLLGQTLGNFDATGRSDLVSKLYDTLSPSDMFLVGVELRPEDNDPLYYQEIEKIKANYLKDEDFARKGLSRLDRLNPNLKLDVGYDSDSDDIVINFVSSRRIILPKRTINVARSHKFSVNELEELFTSAGFNIIGRRFYTGNQRELNDQTYDGRKEYALYLVRK